MASGPATWNFRGGVQPRSVPSEHLAGVQHIEPPLKINVKESIMAYGQDSGDQAVACRNQIENTSPFCPSEGLLHGHSWIYTVFNKTLVTTRDLNM